MRASIAIALIATACRLVVAGSALACPPDPSSCTLAGPPDRITAFGFIARKACSAFWYGTISQ